MTAAPSTTPTLPAVLRALVSNAFRSTFAGWMPGRVESYDVDLRKATVALLLTDTHPVTGEPLPYPVLVEVPVLMPFHIKAPVPVGSTVLVIFGARSSDRWLQQGGSVDPDDLRTHDINDALAIPGLMDFAHVQDASPGIEFTGSEIHAGGTAPLATKADVSDLKTAIVTLLTTLSNGGSASPVTGTAVAGALTTFTTDTTLVPAGTSTLKGA